MITSLEFPGLAADQWWNKDYLAFYHLPPIDTDHHLAKQLRFVLWSEDRKRFSDIISRPKCNRQRQGRMVASEESGRTSHRLMA